MKKAIVLLFFAAVLGLVPVVSVPAQEAAGAEDVGPNIPVCGSHRSASEDNREVALSIQLLLILAVITLAPSIILLMTSFLRIAIVFDFIKRALSLQQVPPNQVLMGIALF